MESDNRYQVAIIGGGIAGLSLAILCAQYGLKAVVIEKDDYPRHKVCGEYVSLESAHHFHRLGLEIDQKAFPFINRLQISDSRGNGYDYSLPLGGVGISRFLLDDLLYKRALSCSVEVVTNTRVEHIVEKDYGFSIISNNGSFLATIAVNAFGKRSNLDVNWKRNFTTQKENKISNWVGVKYHINYDFPNDLIALHNFKDGYCGISKVEHDKVCLCYLTQAKNLKDCGGSIARMEEQILFANPRLKEIFTQAKFLYEKPLAISQVSFSEKKQVEHGMMMIGDSAGLITPLCGNGMSMAFHSSFIAFENLLRFFKNEVTREEMLHNYSKQWRNNFRTRLFIGRKVQSLFGNPLTTSLFLSTMQATPFLAKRIIKLTHGKSF